MTNDIDIQLLGADAIDNILNELPQTVRRKFLLAAWRRSAKPLIQAARQNVQGYSKNLAKSIGNITGRSKKYPTIYVGPRAKGKWKDIGWIAPFIEFGVSGVKRNRKQGYKRDTDNPAFAWVGNIQGGGRYRDDQPPRPFMRPAIMANAHKVEANMLKELKYVMQKKVEKHNRSTSLNAYAKAKGRI